MPPLAYDLGQRNGIFTNGCELERAQLTSQLILVINAAQILDRRSGITSIPPKGLRAYAAPLSAPARRPDCSASSWLGALAKGIGL
jgi:hypothetical protein